MYDQEEYVDYGYSDPNQQLDPMMNTNYVNPEGRNYDLVDPYANKIDNEFVQQEFGERNYYQQQNNYLQEEQYEEDLTENIILNNEARDVYNMEEGLNLEEEQVMTDMYQNDVCYNPLAVEEAQVAVDAAQVAVVCDPYVDPLAVEEAQVAIDSAEMAVTCDQINNPYLDLEAQLIQPVEVINTPYGQAQIITPTADADIIVQPNVINSVPPYVPEYQRFQTALVQQQGYCQPQAFNEEDYAIYQKPQIQEVYINQQIAYMQAQNQFQQNAIQNKILQQRRQQELINTQYQQQMLSQQARLQQTYYFQQQQKQIQLIQTQRIRKEELLRKEQQRVRILQMQQQRLKLQQMQRNRAQQIKIFGRNPETIVTNDNIYMQPAKIPNYKVPQEVVVSPLGFVESEAYYLSAFEWKAGRAILENRLFKIPTKSMMINEMSKIKLYKQTTPNGSRKIKITHSMTNDYHFAVDPKTQFNNLPLQYYWFAKIITMKMQERGCDIMNPYVPENKFQVKNIPHKYISGIIYKQSQHLKNWELRYIVIGPEGLLSYKSQTSAESFKVPREKALQLWTRFEIRQKMLIIKLLHAGRKTEFGIPITDYTIESGINWLYPFYRLVYDH